MSHFSIEVQTEERDLVLAARRVLQSKLNNDLSIIRMLTPVHTGFLRSNWFWTSSGVAIGLPLVRGVYDRNQTYPDTPWNPAQQSVRLDTNTWYIVNNVYYGELLQRGIAEYAGDRHQGFFDAAIQAFVVG